MKKSNTEKRIEEALEYMPNDTLKAIEIFDEILEEDPNNIRALNGKGSSFMKLNLMNEAEKYFDYSLSIEKTSSALINKGIISKNKKEYEKALYYYEKAIEINPNLNNIITILKNEIHELNDDEIDIKVINYNAAANTLIKNGIEYKKSNKLWDALECYQQAMKVDIKCKSSVLALIQEIKMIIQNELMIKTPELGNSKIDKMKLKCLKTLLIEENPKKALTVMNMILKNDENEIDTLNQKGCVLLLFDECQSSLECFDKCLAIDSNYYYALFNKAIVLRRMRKLDESLNCFDELLKMPELYDKVKPYQLEILDKLHTEAIN